MESKYCLYCGDQLHPTIYYQTDHRYKRRYIHKRKTADRFKKKKYCNGQCAAKHKYAPVVVNYAGFV